MWWTAVRNMSVRGYKVMAVAAMLFAGAMAKPVRRGPPLPPRRRMGAKHGATYASGRGEGGGTCALSGDTIVELIVMCNEQKWGFDNDGCGADGASRFVLTMGAGRTESGSEDGQQGKGMVGHCAALSATAAGLLPQQRQQRRSFVPSNEGVAHAYFHIYICDEPSTRQVCASW